MDFDEGMKAHESTQKFMVGELDPLNFLSKTINEPGFQVSGNYTLPTDGIATKAACA